MKKLYKVPTANKGSVQAAAGWSGRGERANGSDTLMIQEVSDVQHTANLGVAGLTELTKDQYIAELTADPQGVAMLEDALENAGVS